MAGREQELTDMAPGLRADHDQERRAMDTMPFA